MWYETSQPDGFTCLGLPDLPAAEWAVLASADRTQEDRALPVSINGESPSSKDVTGQISGTILGAGGVVRSIHKFCNRGRRL